MAEPMAEAEPMVDHEESAQSTYSLPSSTPVALPSRLDRIPLELLHSWTDSEFWDAVDQVAKKDRRIMYIMDKQPEQLLRHPAAVEKLLAACLTAKQTALMLQVINRAQPNIELATDMFYYLLRACCVADTEETTLATAKLPIELVIMLMQRLRIVPDKGCMDLIAKAYAVAGMWDKIELLLALGQIPENSAALHYTKLLVVYYGKQNDCDKMFLQVDRMMKSGDTVGQRGDSDLVILLLHFYAAAGRLEELTTQKINKLLGLTKVNLDEYIVHQMLKIYTERQDMRQVHQTLQLAADHEVVLRKEVLSPVIEMVGTDWVKLESVLLSPAAAERFCYKWLGLMHEQEIVPSQVGARQLLKCFGETKFWQGIADLTRVLERANKKLDPITKKLLADLRKLDTEGELERWKGE
eukprot:TRINITY_DN52739_c0_g1_i3.p1 TRINITY_DN52739_c0_g1~~TRINITY_DN52739_c0_g1_i3.p1  ORF type:complete len:460 (+),score=34.74 TRINITY_DN52739_c0_g1_i3:150-1382(+)